jgi:hypothetical protein
LVGCARRPMIRSFAHPRRVLVTGVCDGQAFGLLRPLSGSQ